MSEIQKFGPRLLNVDKPDPGLMDTHEEITYTVSLHWSQIETMVRRASRNRNGQCSCGPVIVKIISRRDIV